MNNNQLCFNVSPDFDNSFEVNGDIEIIFNNDYYYCVEVDTIMYDTIHRPTILPWVDRLYIYKKIEAKINDSIYKFNKFDDTNKWIFPFDLAKKK